VTPQKSKAVKVVEMECLQCGHKWTARKKEPACCPRCKRYNWNEEKK
jgi:predicted Zn-ribbon and HTH transcriptional regulator